MTFVLKQLVRQHTANDRRRHLRLPATRHSNNDIIGHNNNHSLHVIRHNNSISRRVFWPDDENRTSLKLRYRPNCLHRQTVCPTLYTRDFSNKGYNDSNWNHMGHGNCYGTVMDELVGLSRPCFIPSRTLQEKRAAKKEKPITAKRRDQLYFEQDRDRQALHTLCRIYKTLKRQHPDHFLASSRNEALLSVCKMYQLIGDMHLLEMKLRAQFQSTNLWNEVHRKMVEAGIIQPAMSSASGVVDMEVDEPIDETSTVDHIGGEVDASREEGRKRGRSIDAAAETDVALALDEPKSKKVCLRANNASEEVNRRGKKRKCETTTTAENDAAPEHKPKRARICAAGASQVQPDVVEVSRIIVIACSLSYFTVVSIFFIPI